MVFTPLQTLANASITSGIYNINTVEYTNNGRIPAQDINNKIEDNVRIVSISQDEDTNLYNLMLRYYLYPDHNVDVYNELNKNEIGGLKNYIINAKIPYIFIYSTNSNLNSVLNNDKLLKSETLYKTEIIEGKLNLIEVN